MELKEGMYVRTQTGIAKVEKIEDDIVHKTKWITLDKAINLTSFLVRQQEIIKSSYNIIDLIEVGDYVNGDRVLDIAKAQIKALYTNKDVNSALLPIINNEIKSVITKEQFESIKYEV